MTNPAPRPNRLAQIFLSPAEPRLRAGWRLLIQAILMLIIAIVVLIPVGVLFFLIPTLQNNLLLLMLAEMVIITGSVFLARWLLDRRSIPSLGLRLDRQILPDLITGIIISGAIMGAIFASEKALGWLTFQGFAWESLPAGTILAELLLALGIYILVGWNEELFFRGYQLQTLASGTNLFWGVLFSSLIFGAAHLGNPGASWAAVVGIFFAGLFLAYGFLRTRQLWLSIGLHIGWNFFEGPLCGFPVSGQGAFQLTRIAVSGPVLWTGGEFGPEAGLIVLPALVLGAGLIYLYTRRRATLTAIE